MKGWTIVGPEEHGMSETGSERNIARVIVLALARHGVLLGAS